MGAGACTPGGRTPALVTWRSSAKPLKVPLTMSVTMETARLRLCCVPLMVTWHEWRVCRKGRSEFKVEGAFSNSGAAASHAA